MSEYFSFVTGLITAAVQFDLFSMLCGLLLVAGCFRLVWGLCVPPAFSGGRT